MGLRLMVPQPDKQRSSREVKILKYWSLFQHELLFVSWGVMDVALLTPFALSLLPWTRYWPPLLFFFGLLLLMLLSFNLTRLMSAFQIRPSIQQTVMAITLLLIIFFTIRALFYDPRSLFDISWLGRFFSTLNTPGNVLWLRDVFLFFMIVLMWARGIQMTGRVFTIDRIGLRLRIGGLLLAPFVIWVGSRSLLWNVLPFILLFFLAGLTAVALTRAEEISREETGFSASLTPRWLLIIVAAGLGIVLAAGFTAVIISGETGAAAVALLDPLWSAFKLTTATALFTIGYLLQPIFEAVEWFLEVVVPALGFLEGLVTILIAFFRQITNVLLQFGSLAVDEDLAGLGDGTPLNTGPETDSGLGLNGQLIVGLLAVAVILAVALLLRRKYTGTAVAERTTLRVSKPVTETEADEGLLQRFRGKFGWRRWRTAMSIRHIYKKMMQTAAENGYPKLDSETPYEYLASLDKAWPDQPQEIRVITEAYVKVRYGELPETKEELNQIKLAWQRLQETRPFTPQS